ncbi:hypothetical protein V3C99_009597 [Haemonchus contortus]
MQVDIKLRNQRNIQYISYYPAGSLHQLSVMNPVALVVLMCVTYSVTEKCAHNRRINYEKFGDFKKAFHLPPKVHKKDYEKDDLVLEFDLYLPNTERTKNITFHAAVLISRKMEFGIASAH